MQNLKSKFKITISSKTFYFLLVLLIFEFLFLNLDKADASALSLGIDPPIIEIKTIPPISIINPLNIQNKGDTQITLQIQIKPFQTKGENGELEYSREALEILKYIQILDANQPVENITLGPKQQKTLNLSINLPKVAGGRADYYFSVIFISTNSPPTKSNSSVNQIGIASNVLLSIGSLETAKAAIEEFSSNLFFEKGPVPFAIRIKNNGAHFIKPKGEITIKNMFGQNIGRLDLPAANVLSGSIRAIPTTWKESFLLGLYTATLNISMSDEGPAFTKIIHFLAFPFQGLIIIVIIAIAVIIIRNRLKLYMDKTRT